MARRYLDIILTKTGHSEPAVCRPAGSKHWASAKLCCQSNFEGELRTWKLKLASKEEIEGAPHSVFIWEIRFHDQLCLNHIETLLKWLKVRQFQNWFLNHCFSQNMNKNCQDFCPHYTRQKSWHFFDRNLGQTMT